MARHIGETEYLEIIARYFGQDPGELSMETAVAQIDGWDSVAVAGLGIELEEEFGQVVELEKIYEVATLRELYMLYNIAD